MISSLDTSAIPFVAATFVGATKGAEFLIDWFHEIADSIALPCTCFERDTFRIIAKSHAETLSFFPCELRQRASDVRGVEVHCVGADLVYFLSPPLVDSNSFIGGFARTSRAAIPAELAAAAVESGWSEVHFKQWLQTVPVCDPQIFERLVHCGLLSIERHRKAATLELEIQSLSQQIDYTYEEISLLHTLTHNLHLSRTTEELAGLCVQSLQNLIECGGSAIYLQDRDQRVHYQSQGNLPFDQAGLGRLLARFHQHRWTQPLVRNKLQHSLLGADFPGLKNLVVVPIGEEADRRGWIVTCNLRGGREFGSVEANLLSSIATILGTHACNVQLFAEHDDLLLGFVRSLVSSLDAKDPHTRGHSERVALIARRLGEQLQLPTSELDDLYLSSLLHDLGKIGVDDRILAKPEPLTKEEFAQIQQHPLIGYQILNPLKNLKSILPGVRNHHESFNGKGYPDKLRGEEIPLMARIIAVADSYDAMISDRPYREGMPVEKLENIFRRGSGEQWDPRVIEAYFAVRDDVRRLCGSYSLKAGNLLAHATLSQSGIFSTRSLGRHPT